MSEKDLEALKAFLNLYDKFGRLIAKAIFGLNEEELQAVETLMKHIESKAEKERTL